MKRLLHLAPLAGLLVVLGLAVGLPQAGAIVNGTPDGGTNPIYPNVGIVYTDDHPWFVGFCSGSLISPTEFLTAGHCTSVFNPARVAHIRVTFDAQLRLSPDGLITNENWVGVTGWETHPDFVAHGLTGSMLNDVGVMHLKDPVDATPVQLPEVGFLDQAAAKGGLLGHEFDIVGYGLNSLDRSYLGQGLQANVTWDGQREFSTAVFKSLTPNDLVQFTGTCFGDSGGPHFYGGDQPNLEVALTSSGDPTCGNQDSSQRLDVPAVHDWLEQFTQ
jgi:secreted trypsin-like serine protease